MHQNLANTHVHILIICTDSYGFDELLCLFNNYLYQSSGSLAALTTQQFHDMTQSIPLLWVLLSLAISGSGQENNDRDIEIPILNVGTGKWPVKLTKQWFEGDTLYYISFRPVNRHSTGKLSIQGFFIFELKAFEEALQTALTLDSAHEIHFIDGTMEIQESAPNSKSIFVRFATGAGSFIISYRNAIKLISAIKKEAEFRHEPSK